MNEASIQTAMDATAIFMQNSDERLKYLNRKMAIMDYESDKAAWIDEGRKEGREKGREEGREEGRKEGRDEMIKLLISLGKITADDVREIKAQQDR